MKQLILIFVLFISSLSCFGQSFTREAGVRGGLTSGLSYRQYLENNLAYEGLLSFRKGGLQFTLLRQIHESSLEEYADNLYFSYGFGAHVGYFYSTKYNFLWYDDFYYSERRLSPLAGIDGYAGVEYRVQEFPITVGLDYKPFFEFSTQEFFRIRIWDLAFTIKYRF